MCQSPHTFSGYVPGWSYDVHKRAYVNERTGQITEDKPSTESTETLAEAVARRNEEKNNGDD